MFKKIPVGNGGLLLKSDAEAQISRSFFVCTLLSSILGQFSQLLFKITKEASSELSIHVFL